MVVGDDIRKFNSKRRNYGSPMTAVKPIAKIKRRSFFCEVCEKESYVKESDANFVVDTAIGYRRKYRCDISGAWHTTSTTLEEFRIIIMGKNMKLMGEITKYLEERYNKYDKVESYTNEVVRHFTHRTKSEVASTLSYMKKDGILTSLDKRVPSNLQKGGNYFALTSILDKVTSPTKKEEVSKEMTNNAKVPNQVPPKPAATNPFDSVNAKLATISNQLEEFNERFDSDVPAFTPEDIAKVVTDRILSSYEQLLKKVDAPVKFDRQDFHQLIASSPFLVKRFDVAEACYSAFNKNFVKADTNHTELMTVLKVNGNNVTDDYQRGLRDGIRMAVEMGLIFRNGE